MHLAQVLPCPATVAAQIRKSIGGFVRAGLFTVPLERLCRPALEGGLGLLHHVWKPMSMFVGRWESTARSTTPHLSGEWLRTLQQRFVAPRAVPSKVAYFKVFRQHSELLPADYIGKALSRAVYDAMLQLHPPPPVRVAEHHPETDWSVVWTHTSSKAVPAHTRTAWYLMVHDLVATKVRLHHTRLAESPLCPRCGLDDTLLHRLVKCSAEGRQQWDTCAKRVAYLAGVNSVPPDILLRPDVQGRTPEESDEISKLLSTTAVALHKCWLEM